MWMPRPLHRTSSARLATTLFESAFSARPIAVASAPGRVNLIGEHTDYNGGPVLPVALERRTAVAAGHGDDWLVASTLDPTVRALAIDAPLPRDWTAYVVGVVRELRSLGAAPPGAHVAVGSTLPAGAGLSSSAALTVAAARALSLLAGRRLTPGQLAEVAYRAEHDQVGVRGGRMDQTVAVHAQRGTALLFETATGSMLRVPLRGRVWVVETGRVRELAAGALNQRRRECEEALALCRGWRPGMVHLAQLAPGDLPEVERRLPPSLVRRVRHLATETARTRAAAAALAAGDPARAGRLLLEGHESLRLDYESTVPEADYIVASAVARGAWGARLTGAGWGGAVVVLAPPEREARIMAEVGADFAERYGRTPEVWSSRASSGVRREPVPV